MSSQPIHPERFDPEADRRKRNLEFRIKTLTDAGVSWLAAFQQVTGWTPSGAPTPEPSDDPLYRDVERDEMKLDAVVRALQTEREMTYAEALSWLPEQAERCPKPPDTACLSDVLSTGGASPSRVRALMAADQEQVYALEAAAGVPKPENEVDDNGEALLPADVDPDDLLADPKAPKKAFRRARELGLLGRYGDQGEPVGEGQAYEDFKREWRIAVDGGRDLVATLALRSQGQDDVLTAIEQAQKRDAKIRRERKQREDEERGRLEEAAERLKKLPRSNR